MIMLGVYMVAFCWSGVHATMRTAHAWHAKPQAEVDLTQPPASVSSAGFLSQSERPSSLPRSASLSASVKGGGISLLQEEVRMTSSPPLAEVDDSADMTILEAEVIKEDVEASSRLPWTMMVAVAVLGMMVTTKLVYMLHSESLRKVEGESTKDACREKEKTAALQLDRLAEVFADPPSGEPAYKSAEFAAAQNFSGEEVLLLQQVSKLPVHSGNDISPARKSYDCVFAQPQEEIECCRLLGRVKASASAALPAPVSGQESVMFSTSAVELRMDGVHAPPVAYYAVALDFEIELLDSEEATVVHVRGSDVALFGLQQCRNQRRTALRDASEELQSFVRTHRTSPTASPISTGPASIDGAVALDFTESCLPVGATVACVGKLSRTRTGRLELSPCERSRLGDNNGMLPSQERVLISDNAMLLRRHSQEP
mmetsp:Transcript_66765/g.159701  ORF Transcript_66765/g.159701 Transcript_66765/m.159701 type:complete len:428 (+) Transcript_66765:174-1457(+)